METSLLVAPKPSMSMSRTVSKLVSTSRTRCIVASAAKDTKRGLGGGRRSNNAKQQQQQNASIRQLTVAASTTAAMSQCQAAATAVASPEQHQWNLVALVVGDLDPATAAAAIGVTGPALSALGFLFIVRIVMSWYPRLPVREFPYVVAYAPTEPFLAVTRKVIPAVGGVDVTPVVWFGLVSFLNEILVGPQGLLLLLSQQKP